MKFPHPVLLACSLAVLTPGPTRAQEDDLPSDDLARSKASVSVKDATPDEFLVAIARTADVNIIADATMPAGGAPPAAPITRQVDSALQGLLLDAAETQKMHVKRFGQRTFLFWRPPQDPAGVARQIVDEMMSARRALPVLSSRQVAGLWDDYFRRQHGWNGEHEAVIDVKLAALPTPLRERALVEARLAMMPLFGSSFEFFVPEIWQKSSLFVGAAIENDKRGPIPYLRWYLPLEGGGFSTNVGRLEALGARGRTP